jgi:DNA-directed RNA polymerase specialized sigma24 family protein
VNTNTDAAPFATLLENHRAFLRYLERRVGDPALAEDILQDAFAKVVARPEQGARRRIRHPVVLSHAA